MARINEMGVKRIAYPDKIGETVLIAIHISKEDELKINGVKIDLPEEVYNVTFVD